MSIVIGSTHAVTVLCAFFDLGNNKTVHRRGASGRELWHAPPSHEQYRRDIGLHLRRSAQMRAAEPTSCRIWIRAATMRVAHGITCLRYLQLWACKQSRWSNRHIRHTRHEAPDGLVWGNHASAHRVLCAPWQLCLASPFRQSRRDVYTSEHVASSGAEK